MPTYVDDVVDTLMRRQVPAVGPNNLRNCDGSLYKPVLAALVDVERLAAAAASYPPSGKYWAAWFGKAPSSGKLTDPSIKKRYDRLAVWLSKPHKDLFFKCDFDNKSETCAKRPTIIGFTSKGASEITLCNSFFHNSAQKLANQQPPSRKVTSVPLNEYVVQGSQLMHEMTHAIYSTDDHILTDGYAAYSHENTLRLAKENATSARTNADSYSFFALAAYFNESAWSIDPDNLNQPPTPEPASGGQPADHKDLLAVNGNV